MINKSLGVACNLRKDSLKARSVILQSFEMQEFLPGVDKSWEDAYAGLLALRKQHQDMV